MFIFAFQFGRVLSMRAFCVCLCDPPPFHYPSPCPFPLPSPCPPSHAKPCAVGAERPALAPHMKTATMAPCTEYTTQGPPPDLTLFIKAFACFISAGRPCRHPQASANLISLFTGQQCPGFRLCLAALRSFISIPGHGPVDHKEHESRRGIHQFFVNLRGFL